MNTYYCEYEYIKATEETPYCLCTGESEVVAHSKDEAKKALTNEAKFHGINALTVTKITLKD